MESVVQDFLISFNLLSCCKCLALFDSLQGWLNHSTCVTRAMSVFWGHLWPSPPIIRLAMSASQAIIALWALTKGSSALQAHSVTRLVWRMWVNARLVLADSTVRNLVSLQLKYHLTSVSIYMQFLELVNISFVCSHKGFVHVTIIHNFPILMWRYLCNR